MKIFCFGCGVVIREMIEQEAVAVEIDGTEYITSVCTTAPRVCAACRSDKVVMRRARNVMERHFEEDHIACRRTQVARVAREV